MTSGSEYKLMSPRNESGPSERDDKPLILEKNRKKKISEATVSPVSTRSDDQKKKTDGEK